MDIQTDIYHLQELPLYAEEKPYTIRYVPDADIPTTNVSRHKRAVNIHDMRGKENQYSLERNGFMIKRIDSSMTYEDFDNSDRITGIYLQELRVALLQQFTHCTIDFVSYLIRKRDSQFPYSTGQQYNFGQPNIVAHIDATADDLKRQIARRNGERAVEMTKGRNQYITIWKPLKGPLYDWPLALCDGRTVNPELDLQPQDIVDSDEVLENVHVYHRPGHKWYYLSGQQSNELLVFRQADTMPGSYGTPHCAIANPRAPEGSLPRESIEVVAFVTELAWPPCQDD